MDHKNTMDYGYKVDMYENILKANHAPCRYKMVRIALEHPELSEYEILTMKEEDRADIVFIDLEVNYNGMGEGFRVYDLDGRNLNEIIEHYELSFTEDGKPAEFDEFEYRPVQEAVRALFCESMEACISNQIFWLVKTDNEFDKLSEKTVELSKNFNIVDQLYGLKG